ncbi:MAG: glycosyl transferase group 1 [Parcubacteria group bacterium LiPW_15]|nr:MAG: glycosyl transferase group 1 [Parcubacteria group bacterium LiPW_15]
MRGKIPSIVYFGGYDPEHARPRTTLKGLRRNGVEVFECQSRRPSVWIRSFELAKMYFEVYKKADLILVCAAGQAYVPLAKILGLLTGRRVILDAFISYYHVRVAGEGGGRISPNSIKAKYFFALDFVACKLADLIFLDTEEHGDYFNKTFKVNKKKIRIYPVGSDEDIFFPRDAGGGGREVLKIFCVASFYPLHGIETIVAAAKILASKIDLKITILGSGPEKDEIIKLVRKDDPGNLIFLDSVPAERLPEIMAKADICLGHFGDTEQAGMVVPFKVWDAAAMGKPVITRYSAPAARIFTDGENIVFCRPADPKDLADAIIKLSENQALRKKIAENGRDVFLKKGITVKTGAILAGLIGNFLSGDEENETIKLAAFVSHPIHYVIDLYKEIAKNPVIDLSIYFGSDFSIRPGLDETFGKVVRWYGPEILDGLKYTVLKNYSPYSSVGRFFSLINPGIYFELWRNGYDAIFVNGWNYFSNWLAILAAVLTGTPIIMRGESPLFQNAGKSGAKLFLKKIILSSMFRFVSAFMYIGEENKKFYMFYGVPARKLFFAPYAVDNEKFRKKYEELGVNKAALKSGLDLPQGVPLILFLGKLVEKKRPKDLLLAFEKLLGRGIQAGLVFVGDGPLRGELEKYAREKNILNIHFVGFKSQEEITEYYAVADIFVLPSETGETWGLVVNEAMCFSLPVLVSDIVGCGPDLVESGENGYIFKVGDVNELASRLGYLAADAETRALFGQKSYERVSRYNYKKDAEAILSAVKTLKNENFNCR